MKNWQADEAVVIGHYLRSINGCEMLIKLRDNKGSRTINNTTLADEVMTVVRALVQLVRKAGEDQARVNQAFEGWIEKYLIEGARARLLHALRVRHYRDEQAIKKPAVAATTDLETALRTLLKKHTKAEIKSALDALAG